MDIFCFKALTNSSKTKIGFVKIFDRSHEREIMSEKGLEFYTGFYLPAYIVSFLFLLEKIYLCVLPINSKSARSVFFLFSALLRSGCSVSTSLNILSKSSTRRLKIIFKNLESSIKNGEALSSVMARYTNLFPRHLASAFNQSLGNAGLANLLDNIDELKKILSYRKQFLSTVLPKLISFIVVFIFGFEFVYYQVRPLWTLFVRIGKPVSSLTTALVHMSIFLHQYPLLILSTLIATFLVIKTTFLLPPVRRQWCKIEKCLPFYSKFVFARERVLFFNVFATTLNSGYSLQQALLFARNAISNSAIQEKMTNMINLFLAGETMGVSIRGVKLFTRNYAELMKMAAASNDFSGFANKIYHFSKEEFMLTSRTLISLFASFLRISLFVLIFSLVLGSGLVYLRAVVFLMTPAT